jgi:hypothetical protein
MDPTVEPHLSPLDEDQLPIVIPNALGQVDIRRASVSIHVAQGSPQNRDVVISLEIEADILGGGLEVTTIPVESA